MTDAHKSAVRTTIITVVLFLSLSTAIMKLVGDSMEARKEMKACQDNYTSMGFTDHEAKGWCRR